MPHPSQNPTPEQIDGLNAIRTHVETAIPELAATLNPPSDPPMPAKLGGL